MENEVTQADREAAAERVGADRNWPDHPANQTAQRIRYGHFDGHAWVQAFARHRQQAEDAMRERCIRICETTVVEAPLTPGTLDGASVALHTIATAIQAATLSKEVE